MHYILDFSGWKSDMLSKNQKQKTKEKYMEFYSYKNDRIM